MTAPDNHLAARPNSGVEISRSWRAENSCGQPGVSGWIVPASGAEGVVVIKAAPNDHFAPGPDRRVTRSRLRSVIGGGCSPFISRRVVSASCVYHAPITSTPDDHLTAGPDRRALNSGVGSISGAGLRP